MGNSRGPGPVDWWRTDDIMPPRTPGTLGRFDQSDPNACALLGDTPGPVGINDGAACYSGVPFEEYQSAIFAFDLQDTFLPSEVAGGSLDRQTGPDPDWTPPRPDFESPSDKFRTETFGEFKYTDDENNPDGILITDGWDEKNIVTVAIPELAGVPFGWGDQKSNGKIRFNKKVAGQLKRLFGAWKDADLLSYILTYDGSYNPRYMRKAKHVRKNLSNHAWGTAFDINAKWNPLSHPPAKLGEAGCVFELVGIANDCGFYWGGHYLKRPDGMHFEIGKLL